MILSKNSNVRHPICRVGRSHAGGFTFVELCIVMVIVGVLVAAGMQGLTIYYQKVVFDKTKDNIAEIENELRAFVADNGAYPCPADPVAAPNTATYGQANCGALASIDAGGGRIVRIGTVPTRALGIGDTAGLDGWGQKLIYAVTESLTTAPINGVPGAISVIDKGGNELTQAGGDGHYVLFSAGPDGKGAYTAAGVLVEACPDDAVDAENCNNDATFRYSEERSLTGNNFNFDDVVAFRSTLASSNEADCDPALGEVIIDFDNGVPQCGPVPVVDIPNCGPDEYMVGIDDGAAVCRQLPTCAANQALRGFEANGTEICIPVGGGAGPPPPPPPPTNASCGAQAHGSTWSGSCAAGYTGTITSRCNNGTIVETANTCVRDCANKTARCTVTASYGPYIGTVFGRTDANCNVDVRVVGGSPASPPSGPARPGTLDSGWIRQPGDARAAVVRSPLWVGAGTESIISLRGSLSGSSLGSCSARF